MQAELEALVANGGRVVALGPGAGPVRSVLIDNTNGARDLGQAMAGLGYRDAIVLAAGDGVLTSDDRIEGFTRGFTAEGGAVSRIYRGGFTREHGSRMMAHAMTDGIQSGTLVFAISDVLAIGAMSAIRGSGRAVGADIALCGFDDIPGAQDVTPGLTSVRVPLEDVGYLALRAAVDEEWTVSARSLPIAVVVRDSTPVRPAA